MLPLTIARLKSRSRVMGPGCRAVVWTHGCSKKCPHCIAGEMNAVLPQFTYSSAALYEWVKNTNEIEGITVSGGEPFEQDIDALGTFLCLAKNDPRQLSVMVYTGKLVEELRGEGKIASALRYIDVLVDGMYKYEEDDGQRWRGSGNQRFIFLTDRYQNQADDWNAARERQVEIELDLNGKVLISGVPSKDFIRILTKKVGQHGVDLDFS